MKTKYLFAETENGANGTKFDPKETDLSEWSNTIKITEHKPQGVREFNNGISQYHADIQAITKALHEASLVDPEDEDPTEEYEFPANRFTPLAEKMYALLNSKEESLKFIDTIKVLFPSLLVNHIL